MNICGLHGTLSLKDEGFGTPVVEAQACGIPVVSNNIKDLTKHYEDGIGGYSSKIDKNYLLKKLNLH